ncbi:aminotransferase class I/II-fold pyridoxal phosphate-dependent enzyme [Robertkochia marina]|uniref:Aminotransferase class I/II-fold pyridoxal phosphate-dependent enzyme n=1 Tax=Robertkochia marina TaxID=1227945 RepID=A0A4S3M057_9FLAO|nr:aminotransferase class I/II-fold pyridoxal phosphate-dependent enzyme [Robertkochia marina]THD67711.1 aminotransferase class I/II-fold pyridoxal phosphate-dependent enzyme [Robertkochia marina]TRZ43442.1 aminotransferase class I/II-fold pyridoxal phosphate-dependent enzyme [Robertkochia marina]
MGYEIDHFPGRTLVTDKGEYIYFGGTAYLGLQTHPEFLERYQKNLEVYGTTYAASRHSNVQLNPFERGEQWLAGITGAEKALYVSSGFAACQLVRKYMGMQDYKMFFAPHTHAALRLPGDENVADWFLLRKELVGYLDKHQDVTPVLFVDTVDFAGEKPLQLDLLKTLPLEKISLVADDSHAIGITGQQGGGSYSTLKSLEPKHLVVVGSMGKGFAIGGGFLLGEAKDLLKIEQDPWFGGSGPGTPAGLMTLIESAELLEAQRKQLMANTELFVHACKYLDRFSWSEGYPCFTVSDNDLPGYLENRGMVITNFHYPNANSPLMCRIVISAFHTENDILRLATTLNDYYK